MKQSDFPQHLATPIAQNAAPSDIATIPATQARAGDGTASLALGFPPETFIARSAGGVPPRGQDMNGLLHLISKILIAYQAGCFGAFDAGFAQSIGGYPSGAVVAGASVGTFWVSTADNNISVPGESGSAWKSLIEGLATQAWANGLFASLAGLNTEIQRATTIESNLQTSVGQKVNRAGDIMTGYLFTANNAPSMQPGQWNHSPALRSYTNTRAGFKLFAQDQVNGGSAGVLVYDWSGTDQQYWWFNSDGSITQSSKGAVAFTADLPTSGPLNGGYYTKTAGVLTQYFTVTTTDNTLITYPIPFSGTPYHINIEVNNAIDCDHSYTNESATGFWVHLWQNGQITIKIMAVGPA